ncbi:MAG: hypothetical protein AAF355_12955 [Myxococcota bacterium]
MDVTRRRCASILALACCGSLFSGCTTKAHDSVQTILPSQTADCRVRSYPLSPPPNTVTPVAMAQVKCDRDASTPAHLRDATRLHCERKLFEAACELGGDTVFSYRWTPELGASVLVAYVGLALPDPVQMNPPCVPECSPGMTCFRGFCIEACDPQCRNGRVCRSGQCVSLCNPSCADEQYCDEHGVCQLVQQDAEPGDAVSPDSQSGDAVSPDAPMDQEPAGPDESPDEAGDSSDLAATEEPNAPLPADGAEERLPSTVSDQADQTTLTYPKPNREHRRFASKSAKIRRQAQRRSLSPHAFRPGQAPVAVSSRRHRARVSSPNAPANDDLT